LLNQIIVDKEFSTSIMDVIESTYFDNKYFKIILQMIKEYHTKYESTPNFETLDQIVKSEISQELVAKIVIDTIKQVKEAPFEGSTFVQEKALKFCKQQELQKAMDRAQKIINEGDFESYDKVEGLVREALQVGERDTGITDIFSNLDTVLDDDFRHPIPMGIPGIDKLLKGGLAKGEIGVILAPTGVGKTTILTKIANTAFNLGYNVIQIFFEDNPKIVQRKHFTLWTGIEPDNLVQHKEEVISKINEIHETMKNELILKKLPSDSMTMLQIKNQLRKLIADSTKLDLVLLDYIDCVVPESSSKDEWKAEGSVMRHFEAMCHELNLVGWTATQGNRSSISAEVVTTDQMGGSIKKAQVGHVIISVAKTLQQKEMNLATIAITKSRIGKDGVVFENCKFNNELLEIDTESSVTFLGFGEQQEERKRDRVKELMEKRKEKEEQSKQKLQ
ncbi:MAG: DnaB-like helicase C-terminal domain-containing protein, partial [Alphaproteobacteria bacterium]